MNDTKVIKAKCKATGKRFAVELQSNKGTWEAVNFIEIDDETANSFRSELTINRFVTAASLIPCRTCGTRSSFSCSCARKKKSCKRDAKYDFQCIYCDKAEIDCGIDAQVWLVLDTSGSMDGAPLREAKRAAVNMVNQLRPNGMKIGVVYFESSVGTACELTKDYDAVARAIQGLPDGGGTKQPMTHVYRQIKKESGRKFIVILTDGMWSDPDEAVRVAENFRQENAEIFAIGFGSADHAFLKRIATSDDLAVMTSTTGLVETFSQIGNQITNETLNIKIPRS